VGSSLGLATNLGLGVGAQFLDRPLPYSHQYSLGVQRELPWNWLVDASYVGNITHKLPVSVGLNFIPTPALTSLPVADRPAFFNAQTSNPMANLLPGSGINGSTVPRLQLMVAYPEFSGVSISNVPIGSQRYDALQVKGTRRFSRGIAMQVAYTVAKTLEQVSPLNPQDVTLNNLLDTPLEKRLIEFDTPQKIAVVTSWELPLGKGKAIGGAMHPVANGVVGGWNLNVQWMRQSGFPFNFPNGAPVAARSAKFNDSQRDALAQKAGRPQFDVLFDKWFDVSLFPTPQAPFTLRSFPTRFPDVRSKPLDEWEISVYKEFPIKERVRWQIRADFQNAFNHPFFVELLTTDIANSRFGQLRPRDRNEPRKVVAVMKIIF
jgi:hypothetical protein